MVNGQRDRVAWSAVDFDHLTVGGFDSQHRIVRVVDHAGDHDVLQLRAEFGDHALEQVVSQRPGRCRSGQPAIDAGRFEDSDQNRKRTLAADFPQVDNLLVVDFADDNPRQLHFDEHGGDFPAEI